MMFKKLLLSLLVTVPVVAQAEWIVLDKGEEFTIYVDPDRTVATVKSLKHAEAWFKAVVHNDLTKDGMGIGDFRLMKYKFKCDTNELSLDASYDYRTGKQIDSYVARYNVYSSAIPETKGELMAFVVCGYLYGEE